MFESFGFEETTAREISVLLALAIGLVFGGLAERTGFCFRRAVIGADRYQARGVWLMALATAVLGTQAAVHTGLISFADHRFLAQPAPLFAIVLGGMAFGIGMVLTRGCVSRLTVLSGNGNLRAALVLAVFAITAHATMKGVLAPIRSAVGAVTVDLGPLASLSSLPGGATLWAGLIVAVALGVAARSGNRTSVLLGAALIGLLVPVGWVGTGYILFDEFDPIAMQSLSFTAPWADSLFFTIAATSIPASFGPGLIGGVLAGALLASLLFGTFRWQSFETPGQTARYLSGAALMGVGGVLAGGCTVGAGLAGIPTLALPALLVLASITLGAKLANAVLSRGADGSSEPHMPLHQQPAE